MMEVSHFQKKWAKNIIMYRREKHIHSCAVHTHTVNHYDSKTWSDFKTLLRENSAIYVSDALQNPGMV